MFHCVLQVSCCPGSLLSPIILALCLSYTFYPLCLNIGASSFPVKSTALSLHLEIHSLCPPLSHSDLWWNFETLLKNLEPDSEPKPGTLTNNQIDLVLLWLQVPVCWWILWESLISHALCLSSDHSPWLGLLVPDLSFLDNLRDSLLSRSPLSIFYLQHIHLSVDYYYCFYKLEKTFDIFFFWDYKL